MKIPRIRQPKVMDFIRIDGRLHAVVSIDSRYGPTLEPLADVIGRHMLVGTDKGPVQLYDAMLERGWTPPDDLT